MSGASDALDPEDVGQQPRVVENSQRPGLEESLRSTCQSEAQALAAHENEVLDIKIPSHCTSAPPPTEVTSPDLAPQQHELTVHFELLRSPVRLLEVIDSEEATQQYREVGEEDPFGAKAWPASYLAAQRLLAEGLSGCSVLELGCGTGLISIAALVGGASFVLATDRAGPNCERSRASARLNGVDLCAELFDVTLPQPLPSRHSPACGNLRSPTYEPKRAADFPDVWDFVVFSDVLYWPKEAKAFGRRAAEAYASGSTVVVADPGRRKADFLEALQGELIRLGVEPLPSIDLVSATVPQHVFEWVSSEVKTASQMFCDQPFELVLRPPCRTKQAFEISSSAVGAGSSLGPVTPTYFEAVD